MEIIPTIETNSPQELREKIEKLNDVILPTGFPLARVQIDINDGSYLSYKTIEPSLLGDVDTDLKIDFHLMTKEPVDWVERCVAGGGDRLIGQIEKMSDQVAFVGKVQKVGIKIGLALDIATPLDEIDPTILTNLDVILLMGYPAGIGGQKFDTQVLDKTRALAEIREKDTTPFRICVDGGITLENIKSVKMAGADEVTVGERVVAGDSEKNLENFYKACY